MVNYSDIFPLSGGGNSILNGLTWEEKNTDFTAVTGKGYFCSPSTKLLITLPSSPQINDTVGLVLVGGNNIDFISTDKINGNFLATDYGKRISQKYLIFKLSYSGPTNGWTWNSMYDSYIVNSYIGNGTLLTYSSTSTLDGMVRWLGTNKGQSAFTNPHPSLITAFLSTGTSISIPAYFDRDINTSTGGVLGNLPAGVNNGIKIFLPSTNTITPTKIGIYYQAATSANPIIVDGIKNDESLVTIGQVTIGAWSSGWALFTYSGNEEFKGFYFHSIDFRQLTICEIEAWGIFYG